MSDEHTCRKCGKPATHQYSTFRWGIDPYLCDEHDALWHALRDAGQVEEAENLFLVHKGVGAG